MNNQALFPFMGAVKPALRSEQFWSPQVYNSAVHALKQGRMADVDRLLKHHGAAAGAARVERNKQLMEECFARMQKQAKSLELKELIKAKEHSDSKDYGKKNEVLQRLLQTKPEEFVIDSHGPHSFVGLTHLPTKFKIHAPRNLIPVGINEQKKQTKAEC